MTLYLDLGGRPALTRSVTRLSDRLHHDPVFMTTTVLKDREYREDLTEFLCFMLGGAPFYEGRGADALFGPFCDCDLTFDHFIDHLVTVILGHSGSSPTERKIRARFEKLRKIVLGEDSMRDQEAATKPEQQSAGGQSALPAAAAIHNEQVSFL